MRFHQCRSGSRVAQRRGMPTIGPKSKWNTLGGGHFKEGRITGVIPLLDRRLFSPATKTRSQSGAAKRKIPVLPFTVIAPSTVEPLT